MSYTTSTDEYFECKICGHLHRVHDTCVHPLAAIRPLHPGLQPYADAVAQALDTAVPVNITHTEGAS